MAKSKTSLKKPILTSAAVVDFAEGRTKARPAIKRWPKPSGAGEKSRFPPSGDVRLTVNVREDLHLRLKIAAARRRTTVGQILEELVSEHVPA